MDNGDLEDDLIDETFEALSQSQHHACAELAAQPLLFQPKAAQLNADSVTVTKRKKKDAVTRKEPGSGEDHSVADAKRKTAILQLVKDIAKSPATLRRKCFEHTILDDVDTIPNKIELQEVGEWLQASAQVYGFRVENTFSDAYATHCSLMPALGGMGGEADTETKKNRVERKAHQLAAQQTANLEKLYDVQADGGEEGEEAPDFFATETSREEEEDSNVLDYDRIAYSDTLYHDIIEKECIRKEEALAAKRGLNPYLIQDENRYRMQPALMLNNEYYQAATSRYKEHNASGLLTYNAKVSHNGRMTMLHKHMSGWVDADASDRSVPKEDLRGAIAGLIENAMAEKPKELKNNLFADEDCVEKLSGLALRGGLAEMERCAREAALQRQESEICDMEYLVKRLKSGKENIPAKEREGLPKEPSPESSQTGEEHEEDLLVNAVPIVQATDGTEEEMETMAERMAEIDKVLSDDVIPDGPSLITTGLPAYFAQILQTKLTSEEETWNRGAQAEELQAEARAIHEDTFNIEAFGIDDDLRELDFVWNAHLVRKRVERRQHGVKDEPTADSGASSLFSQSRRRLELPPGEYEFMAEPDEYDVGVPVDELALVSGEDQPMARVVDNASDEGADELAELLDGPPSLEPDGMEGPIRIDLPVGDEGGSLDLDEGFGDDDPSDGQPVQMRSEEEEGGEEERRDPIDTVIPSSNEEAEKPSQIVTKIGRTDDSHWKLATSHPENQKEKKEKKKRGDKAAKQMIKAETDYFSQSAGTSNGVRVPSIARFVMVEDANDLRRPENAVLQQQAAVRMVPQEKYEFDLLFRPFILPTELFGKFRIDNLPERGMQKEDGLTEDEIGDVSQRRRRPSAYSRLLEAAKEAADQDTYLAFLNTYKDYSVTDCREAEMEERRKARLSQRRSQAEADGINDEDEDDDIPPQDTFDDYIPPADEDMNMAFPRPRTPEQIRESEAKSVVASSHGYGMRLYESDYDEEEDMATAFIMGTKYNLKQLKLDAVAMKSALSDVLTNPMMVAEKLDETLAHFSRLPTQRSQKDAPIIDLEQTIGEVPDALEVTRALFAPPQETKQPDITMMYREASPTRAGETEEERMKSYFNRSQEITMIAPRGHHTLKSTFTCLPVRMPQSRGSEVTVASTIAMMLHLANENNLILDQAQPEEGLSCLDEFNAWMNDFEVHAEDEEEDSNGRRALDDSRIGEESAANILASLADAPIDSHKVLEEVARQQKMTQERQNESDGGATGDVHVTESARDTVDKDREERKGTKRGSPSKTCQSCIRISSGSESSRCASPVVKRTRGSGGKQSGDVVVLEDSSSSVSQSDSDIEVVSN